MRVNAKDINVREHPCKLHACLRNAMRLCRWAGLFPLEGLDQLTADGKKCRIKCLYGIYNMITITGMVAMLCFSCVWFVDDLSLSSLSKIIFFGTSLISAILLRRLAQEWPLLIKKAKDTEKKIIQLKIENCVIRKASLYVYVIMAMALVEHILTTYYGLKLVMESLDEAAMNNKVVEVYTILRMPYVFNYISYSNFRALVTELVSVQGAFIWSFNDVLTICFSFYLTAYLQNLNKLIRSKKNNNTISWGLIRKHYSQLAMLVKEIDKRINSLILMSAFINIFYICLQLFHSLRFVASFNYLYSFIFVIFRALFLFLSAANVHVTAQWPIIAIIGVPSADYDQEVHMFQLQLRFTEVALSGRYFYVTRKMVLQSIGTIITYELVLLQLSRSPNHLTLNVSGLFKNVNGTNKEKLEIINFRLLPEEAEGTYLKKDFNNWIVDEQKDNKDYATQNEEYQQKYSDTSEETQFRSFQRAMTILLAFGQCIALNPVTSILNSDVNKIRFTVCSWRFLFTVFVAAGQTMFAALCINRLFSSTMSIRSLAFVCFYVSNWCTTLLFIRIARKWATLVKEIANSNLDKYIDPNIIRNCNATCLVFLLLGLVEHLMAVSWKVCRILECFTRDYSLYEEIIKLTFPWLFDLGAPYNLPMALVLEITNIITAFNWNYADIFIICTSLYITSLLNQINKRIIWAADKIYLCPSLWAPLREDYTRATRLVRRFDDMLSGLVLVSFAANLFFICLQLFNILANGIQSIQVTVKDCANLTIGPCHGYEYPLYLVYSLTLVCVRFLTVSLLAASVNVASLVPASALYRVPSCCYSKEVQRFLEQVHGEVVALSGLEFFYITRDLVLSVASTIATYELVLLQFSSDELNRT